MSVPTLAEPVPQIRVRSRRSVVPAELRVADNPTAAVLRAAVLSGPLSRDDAARATGLSIATVNRHVTSLLAVGLLRERADLVNSGAIGRPKVPFETDHESYFTLGVHIGAAVTQIVAADLRGRILGGLEIATPPTGHQLALTGIARSVKAFAQRWHRRTPLWTGVAIGGRVDASTGVVDHPRLGWSGAPVGEMVSGALGLPVSVAAHVEAMAAAELLLGNAPTGSTLYFYARETAGVAVSLDGRVHTPNNGPGSIAHLPTGSDVVCECGRRGCLEATVSDRALTQRACVATISDLYRAATAGEAAAQRILDERAVTLGQTAAVLRDMFNPDRVILGGQAFTAYRAALPTVAAAFTKTTTLPGKDIRVSGFANRVQEVAAATASLSIVYADPLRAVRTVEA